MDFQDFSSIHSVKNLSIVLTVPDVGITLSQIQIPDQVLFSLWLASQPIPHLFPIFQWLPLSLQQSYLCNISNQKFYLLQQKVTAIKARTLLFSKGVYIK